MRVGGHRLKTYVGLKMFSNSGSTAALPLETSLETPLTALGGQHWGVNMIYIFDVRLCRQNGCLKN